LNNITTITLDEITLSIGSKILIQEFTKYNTFEIVDFKKKGNQFFIVCVDKKGLNCVFSEIYFSRFGSVISDLDYNDNSKISSITLCNKVERIKSGKGKKKSL
jgi:hypothetical protein